MDRSRGSCFVDGRGRRRHCVVLLQRDELLRDDELQFRLRSFVASYRTVFPLTENPISEGGRWVNVGLDWTFVQTSGGLAFGTQVGGGFDDSYAHLTGFPPNHTAYGIIHLGSPTSGINHEVEILMRWADSAHNARGYECNIAYNGQYATIVRWNGPLNSFTNLAQVFGVPIPNTGDIFSAKIVGNKISSYLNGVLLATATDSTYTTGDPGMGFFRSAPSTPANDFAFSAYGAQGLQDDAILYNQL